MRARALGTPQPSSLGRQARERGNSVCPLSSFILAQNCLCNLRSASGKGNRTSRTAWSQTDALAGLLASRGVGPPTAANKLPAPATGGRCGLWYQPSAPTQKEKFPSAHTKQRGHISGRPTAKHGAERRWGDWAGRAGTGARAGGRAGGPLGFLPSLPSRWEGPMPGGSSAGTAYARERFGCQGSVTRMRPADGPTLVHLKGHMHPRATQSAPPPNQTPRLPSGKQCSSWPSEPPAAFHAPKPSHAALLTYAREGRH